MKKYASKTFKSLEQTSLSYHRNVEFLWKSALKYSTISPFLSRHLMMTATKQMDKIGEEALGNEARRYGCHFCGNLWMSGNCSVKFTSKKKIPKFINSLRKLKKKNPKKLTKRQARILKLYANLSVTQVYKCGVCTKVSKIPLEIPEPKRVTADPDVEFHGNRRVKPGRVTVSNPMDHQKKGVSLQTTKTLKNQKKLQRKFGKGKHLDSARERLLDQIREAKIDHKQSRKPVSANCRMVSTVKNILKTDAQSNKFKPGHQLLSFFNTL